MAGTPGNEIVEGYIEEVKTYIPSLVRGIESLRRQSGQRGVIEEIHRLVHTIKGASSMIGISGLSNIAFQMEEALEDILNGDLDISDEAIQAMDDTVGHFQTYCSEFLDKGVDARSMFEKTILSYRRLRNLPNEKDGLRALLESIPEHEGGGSESGELEPDIELSLDLEPDSFASEEDDDAILKLLEAEVDNGLDWGTEDEDSARESISVLPEFLESFHEEANDHLKDLDQTLGALEDEIVDNMPVSPPLREEIRRIRRNVHTIKGAAAVIGLDNIPKFGQIFEDFIDWLYEDAVEITPGIVALLSESNGLLRRIVFDPADSGSHETTRLKRLYEDIMSTGTLEPKSVEPSAGEPEADIAGIGSTVIPELLDSFNEEAEGHLEDLGRSLNALETRIAEPAVISPEIREIVRQIRRCVHTVKGAAAVIGLNNISSFAHSFEDLLDWLHDDSNEITPETVAVLIDSADLLERIIAEPENPKTARVNDLKTQYGELMSLDVEREIQREPELEPTAEVEIIGESKPWKAPEDIASGVQPQTKTLRVGMDRVDELVNLVGELIIALSAFDQKMDNFVGAVNELDISRNRLRDVARNMEVGYEVKALEQIGSTDGSWGPFFQPASGGDGAESEFGDFDSLELDRYSELNLIIRTLNESVIDVGAINTLLSNLYSDFDGHINRQRVLLSELQNKIMRVRMTPMSTITNRLRRTVRDVARKLSKKIRLVITGEEIELDRLVWEKLTDPLMHLLRNAADHGIEPPALRQALEKPPVATLKLEASREGNQVVIRITDDGAGLNYGGIRKIISENGLSDRSDKMSDEELTTFIFHPGFSTRGKISEISGRGIGLDVVKENIHDLKGIIDVASWKGKGTRFTVRIPLTLAATRALLFTLGGQTFAISLNEVREILRINPGDLIREPENAVQIGDEILPLYHLARVLNIRKEEEPLELGMLTGADPVVLVVEYGGRRGAFIVDSLVGQREIVIKSLGSHLRRVKGLSGATIMGDGSIVPILNVEDLFTAESPVRQTHEEEMEPAGEKTLEILVVDDSVSIRQVVARLMEDQGWKAVTAKDGIDALEKMRDSRPDFVVLDIEMPRMNGYEFLAAVRNQPAYSDIPVAMLTSRTAEKHREKALSLGAKGFIMKPYNDDEFVNLVLELTEK